MTYDNIDHTKNNTTDEKPWWLVSFVISGFLIFLVFALYFIHHNREYLKKVIFENGYFQRYNNEPGKSNRKSNNVEI